ncbi:MAG: ATP-binding protein [Selenomonadaceae bacterium]|nr:ATP-binding protein [Selenomonadaceae bacterium]
MEQNFYLGKLLELKNNFSVKIISGLNGVGKTTLLNAFAENLRSEDVAEEEIIFLNCAADERLRNFQTLYEFVETRTLELEKFFLLIDEIDCVIEGEKAINALFVGMPAEIYVTCSTEAFTEKICALLPDNCDVLKLYPLSFSDYAKNVPADNALQNYLHFGGLPATLNANEKILPTILRGAAYAIMFDLVEKNSLQRADVFHLLMKIIAQNVGKTTSLNQLFDRLKGVASSINTFRNYLSCSTGLFKRIPRFDIKNENYFTSGEKFYCVDNGILCALAPNTDENILMENAVYAELLRRGYSISSGKFGTMNITFLAERADKKLFIQVLPVSGISVRRITRPLRALPADVEKILITSKREKTFGDVRNITLQDFLLGG